MGRRRTQYCARIANDICEHIALGNTLDEALAEVGHIAPAKKTIWKWLNDHLDFAERYEAAQKMNAASLADRAVEMAKEVVKVPSKAPAIRCAFEIYKWNAEMRDPAKFSPKAAQAVPPKPKSLEEMKREIERLEAELGVEHAQPGMATAKQYKNAPTGIGTPAPNLKVVGGE